MPAHPGVRKVLREAFADSSSAHADTLRKTAKKFDIPLATLSAWYGGHRAPSPENVARLAECLYPSDASARTGFSRKLRAAAGIARHDDPLDELIRESRGIRLGIAPYGHFAGVSQPEPRFFDAMFERFRAFAGVAAEPVVQLTLDGVIEHVGPSDDIDVGLALLATVDRLLHLQFFTTPIRISLNAVVHKRFLKKPEQRDEIRSALSVQAPLHARTRIQPLVHSTEVGGLYVTKTLGRKEVVQIQFGNLAAYAKALATPVGEQRIPVAVIDEYTCIQLLREMAGDGELVFDLQGLPSSTSDKASRVGRVLPTYPLGFAIGRQHIQWREYMGEAFSLYLEADAEAIADLYFTLFDALVIEIEAALALSSLSASDARAAARYWTARALGFRLVGDDLAVAHEHGSAAWRTILNRVVEVHAARWSSMTSST